MAMLALLARILRPIINQSTFYQFAQLTPFLPRPLTIRVHKLLIDTKRYLLLVCRARQARSLPYPLGWSAPPRPNSLLNRLRRRDQTPADRNSG